MASEAQVVWIGASIVSAAIGVGIAVASTAKWARDSRAAERLAGSPLTSSLGGLLLAAAGALAASLSLAGLSPWVAGTVLAVGAALAAVLCGIDRTVRWLRSAEVAVAPPAETAEPGGVARAIDERVEDEV